MEEKMNFGQALEALKEGKCVAREGWNGKGMFLFIGEVKSLSSDCLPKYFKGKQPPKLNFPICMKAADDTVVVGWLASQTDMLAEDWHTVTID